MSQSLVGLAADMASFNNVPVDEALQALQSGLTGETEPLKKFGVNLNDAALKAKAMAMGLSDGKGPLDASAKAQASYALIMEQSTTAQGDFARTSDGLANKTKISSAKMEEFQAKIGDKLLPVMTAVTGFIADSLLPAFESISGWIVDNKELFYALGIALGVVGTAVMVTLVPSFVAWAAAAWATAAPLIAIYAPIAALIAIIAAVAYVVIKNWDTIKEATKAAWDWVLGAIQSVWNWIKDNWPLLLAIITGPIGLAVKFVVDHWDTIKGAVRVAWDFIVNLMGTLGGYISAPFSAALGVITGVWGWIKSAAQNAYDFIAGVFGTLGDVITAPIKLAWNALASVWNSTVGAISIKVPDFVPGIGGKGFDVPDLPRLAKGGVLTSPTLFLGGEAGTEIVAPEPMLCEIMREEGAGSSYTLNIYPRTADASDIAYGFRRLELLAGVA